MISFKNFSFKYNNVVDKTLKNIDLTINNGEKVLIVGPSGSGKSTLCRVMTVILKYKKGNIYLNGECIDPWSIRKKGSTIGYVMQNPNQMISQHMIKDEISLGLKCRGYSKEAIEEKVEEVLKICGLYPYRNWPISALSYGQKKRVTIAAILL